MNKKQKKMLYRIIATAVVYVFLIVMEHVSNFDFMDKFPVGLVLFLIPYFY